MTSGYPLEGVRIIALEQYIAGPYCTTWLADCGAEVIKIERPGSGEPRRAYPPFIEDDEGRRTHGGFLTYNRNKKSLALDVKSAEGKAIYKDLAATADIVLDNMRPGTVERLGIGYDDLKDANPGLIYAAVSGFGRSKGLEGPYSDRPAFDSVVLAMSGITHLMGEEGKAPQLGFLGLADLFTGVVTAFEIMLALRMRERTGRGQFIDACMYDNLVSLNERAVMLYTFAGEVLDRGKDKYQAPIDVYTVKDGYISLITPNDMMWGRFCAAIGHPEWADDERTATGRQRAANRDVWEPGVADWMAVRTTQEVIDHLLDTGVPVGPVQDSEDLLNCPHLKARRAFVEVDDPVAGPLTMTRAPVRMSDMDEVPTGSAPRLGEHTEALLRQVLDLGDDRIAELRDAGVIQVGEEGT